MPCWRPRFAAELLAVALLTGLGCAPRSADPAERHANIPQRAPLPKLDLQRYRERSVQPVTAGDGELAQPVGFQVIRVETGSAGVPEGFWDRWDEVALPDAAASALRDAGIACRWVAIKDVARLQPLLGQATSLQRQQIIMMPEVPLATLSAAFSERGSSCVRLPVQGQGLRDWTPTDGQWRWLLRAGEGQSGQVTMRLTPQWFVRRHTLTPRTVLEQQLDGEVLEGLTIAWPATPGRALLVGPTPPAAVLSDQTAEPAQDGAAESPPCPLLGHRLLGGRNREQATQSLLLIFPPGRPNQGSPGVPVEPETGSTR